MSSRHKNILFLVILAGILFLPLLGTVHLFDWDEINFAEISREMLLTGDFLSPQINFLPFYEKPPLFNWLQVISMRIFGIGEFAARLPNAITGIATMGLLYHIGSRIYHHCFGLFWAFAFIGSLLPFFYFKSGIIDPVFNFFIFLAIYSYILYSWHNAKKYLIAGGLLMGLAILTKGPVALLIAIITISLHSIFKSRFDWIAVFLFVFLALIPPGIWLIFETIQNGSVFIHQFLDYHLNLLNSPVAGHKGFPGFHIVILMIGCFPASIFAINSLFKSVDGDLDVQRDFMLWMKIMFWVVLILFSIVQSKIIHYSSLCYFPLTFLAARTIQQISDGDIRFSDPLKFALWSLGAIYIVVCVLFPIIGMNPDWIIPFIKDPFVIDNLTAEVSWKWFHFLPGLILLFVLLAGSWLIFNRRKDNAFSFLFIGCAVFSFLTIALFTPNIERYTQHAAIEFYKEKTSENCYVDTWGFKSYAQLFYTQKRVPENILHSEKNWLLEGNVDIPVYMVVRSPNAQEFKQQYPSFAVLYMKNGFVFFQKDPSAINNPN